MAKPRTIVMTGYAFNCDIETEFAFNLAGSDVRRVHVNDIDDRRIDNSQILVMPGGFTFGDDIRTGIVMANKMRYKIGDAIQRFVESGKLMIGICNGAQVAVNYGLLPALDGNYQEQQAALTFNDTAKFDDMWIHMRSETDLCVFTRGIDRIYLPIAHGEGKFVLPSESIVRLEKNGQVVLRYVNERGEPANGVYPLNPNGSMNDIAGVCDQTGRLFILMPHPERYLTPYTHPHWTRLKQEGRLPKEGDGMKIFRNAVNYFK